jgi:hypothetical protein
VRTIKKSRQRRDLNLLLEKTSTYFVAPFEEELFEADAAFLVAAFFVEAVADFLAAAFFGAAAFAVAAFFAAAFLGVAALAVAAFFAVAMFVLFNG